jgi:hypothetical protein
MSPAGGRAPGLRKIPPAPATYRLRSKEPVRHGFHMYMPPRDLEHAATSAGLSGAAVMVLMAMAHRTDADGTTRAGVRELARHLHRSPGTIQFHMNRLIAEGFVEEGGCREDNRYRVWRIAGMDRRDDIARGPGENHHRGGAPSRDGIARHPATSRDAIARIPVELPGELIEPTRASPQQEPPAPRDWGRAEGAGIQAVREAAAAARRRRDAQSGPEPPAAPLHDRTVLEAGTEAQNGTDSAAEGAA